MIEKTSAFKTSDGKTHASVEDAQDHALGLLGITNGIELLKQKEAVIAILKLKPRKAAKKAPKVKVKTATPA